MHCGESRTKQPRIGCEAKLNWLTLDCDDDHGALRPLAGTVRLKERRCVGWQPTAVLAPQERRMANDERLFEGIYN